MIVRVFEVESITVVVGTTVTLAKSSTSQSVVPQIPAFGHWVVGHTETQVSGVSSLKYG